ncbi:MAG: aminopeptidase, partial [Planctomycetota bacterium]
DLVMISADPVAQPLVEALYEAVLRAGGHPMWRVASESLADIQLELASDAQLDYLNPLDKAAMETVDVRIGVWSEINTRAGTRVPPSKHAKVGLARKPILKTMLDRAAAGELRWCGTLLPTHGLAQDAEMSLRAYERFVFGAGLLHEADPIAAWRAIHDRQERVREFLQGKKVLRFRAPARDATGGGHDGTDLTVDVDGGTWINCSGKENFPDGEVFCGPQGVDGHVNYTFPAVHDGHVVEGVRLEFRAGRCVGASARTNEAYLIEMLDQDQDARNLGEIAIGTNYSIREHTRNTLFDEKIGGTFHAAVGAGYPESGSTSDSALHWDMVCDLRPDELAGIPGGTIEADGEVFHRDGAILIDGWNA